MTDLFISSDPNAWLRPYWQALHQQQSFFANLAPELQANALAEALAEDHPTKAAEIRESNAATRRATIAVLEHGHANGGRRVSDPDDSYSRPLLLASSR